jgi:hypothetical protein
MFYLLAIGFGMRAVALVLMLVVVGGGGAAPDRVPIIVTMAVSRHVTSNHTASNRRRAEPRRDGA